MSIHSIVTEAPPGFALNQERSNVSHVTTRQRQEAPPDLAFSLALLIVALVPRLFVALVWAREPVWDAHYYHLGAERIAAGLGYSEDVVLGGTTITKAWAHYPVGYSAALALVYRVFGSGLLVGPIFGAILGTLIAVTTHRVARYFLSPGRARIAGALVALHPGLIAYSALLMSEPLAAWLILLVLWSALALGHRPKGLVLVGVLLGFSALVRPLSLFLLPALLLVRPRPWLRAFGQTAVIGSIALIVIAPWTIRNCRVMDGCALISTNGGWNLAIGTITETGRFHALKAADGCAIVTGQVEQDRCWARVAAANIEKAPGAWLEKVPRKLSETFDHESFPIEYLHEAAPSLWPEAQRARGRVLLTSYHWLLVLGAAFSSLGLRMPLRSSAARIQALLLGCVSLLGGYCLLSDEHPFFLLVLLAPLLAALPLSGRIEVGPVGRVVLTIVALTALSHAIFFGEDRYHMVLSPLFCLLAAAALRSTPGVAEELPNTPDHGLETAT